MTEVRVQSDSELSISLYGLRSEVAYFLGLGRDSTGWSDDDLRTIDAHIASGLRMFYSSYRWSFLRPWSTLSLSKDQSTASLPDDFGFINGDVSVSDGTRTWAVRQTGPTMLDGMKSQKGIPSMYAVNTLVLPDNSTQKFELRVWPVPDRALTVRYRYSVVPHTLNDSHVYPYGGAMHAETIREACLASAESDSDDQQGIHRQNYLSLLETSKAYDSEQSTPDSLGYNGDGRNVPERRNEMKLYLNGYDINTPREDPESGRYWR